MSQSSLLLIRRPAPGVRRLTMNRPEKRNALNNALRGAIFAALEAAGARRRDPRHHPGARRCVLLRRL